MNRNTTSRTRRARALLLAAVAAGATALAGCDDFLKVTNPGAIEEPNLNDPQYIALMVNGVLGEFQPTYSNVALYSGVFTDELSNHHVFFENRPIDMRDVSEAGGLLSSQVYNPIHRTRFLADSVASRLKTLLADSAGRDLRLARVQALAGYSYVMLGENFCESPLNLSAPYTSDQLLGFAIPRFDEAIAIAAAVKAKPTATAAEKAGADSLTGLARVGAARAYLNVGNAAKAIEYASAVPSPFEFRIFHSSNSSREYNPFENAASLGAGSTWIGVGLPFQNLNDPRVPHGETTEGTMNAVRDYVPNSPPSFSTYSGTLPGAEFTKTASIRLASYLEAQYILHEAQGLTPAGLAFLTQRRAAGSQEPITPTNDAEFRAALRDQRRRDFYLDGHRLGDLRRYKKLYGVDEFPSGPYPGSTSGETYGTQECWPVTLGEKNGNPHYQ